MQTNSITPAQKAQTATAVWQAAVAATRAKLLAQGYSPAKAQKCALDRNKLLHPSHQIAVRRKIAANRDYIVGGAS